MEMQTTPMKVWKYALEVNEFISIDMPKGVVLSAKMQHEKVCIWALVMPEVEYIRRHFFASLTGQELPEGNGKLNFIDTVMTDDGNFVFHVFEIV